MRFSEVYCDAMQRIAMRTVHCAAMKCIPMLCSMIQFPFWCAAQYMHIGNDREEEGRALMARKRRGGRVLQPVAFARALGINIWWHTQSKRVTATAYCCWREHKRVLQGAQRISLTE